MDKILNKQNWDELIAKLRVNYPQLTDDDVKYKQGKEEKMLRMIEYKLGMTKEEMEEIIVGFSMFIP